MTGLLEGKVALVTGGGNGIGRATALLMSREGARVAVADYEAESAANTVAAINAAGGQAISLSGDVTISARVEEMLAGVMAAYGRLDCAFNNAGIAPHQVDAVGQATHEWAEASFDRMIEVNVKSVWLSMKHEIPLLRQSGGGVIVNTASVAGLVGLRNASGYVAAKHAVIGLTKTAALEYAEENIRVNAVCPGFIETRMTELTRQNRGDWVIARTPMRKFGVPENIAEMVVWLCSDRAAYVTGAAYEVDGGLTAA